MAKRGGVHDLVASLQSTVTSLSSRVAALERGDGESAGGSGGADGVRLYENAISSFTSGMSIVMLSDSVAGYAYVEVYVRYKTDTISPGNVEVCGQFISPNGRTVCMMGPYMGVPTDHTDILALTFSNNMIEAQCGKFGYSILRVIGYK